MKSEMLRNQGDVEELYLFYNRSPSGSAYGARQSAPAAAGRKLAAQGRISLAARKCAAVMDGGIAALGALIPEYLFVSLFGPCAESLSSENASRLAAMQRAGRGIDDLLENLNGAFPRLRHSGIDEEQFDVISGFEALTSEKEE